MWEIVIGIGFIVLGVRKLMPKKVKPTVSQTSEWYSKRQKK